MSVRAFCKADISTSITKTITGAIVGGTYVVPEVSLNSDFSRKSYSSCSTGIIALNVTNGSGTFTFNITSAPTGQMPTSWIDWDASTYSVFNISPYTYADFFTENSLSIYIRLKGCPDVYQYTSTNIYEPTVGLLQRATRRGCENYVSLFSSYSGYTGILCYPLNVSIHSTDGSITYYEKIGWLNSVNSKDSVITHIIS